MSTNLNQARLFALSLIVNPADSEIRDYTSCRADSDNPEPCAKYTETVKQYYHDRFVF